MGGSCLVRADQVPLEEQAVAGGKPSNVTANPEGLSETGSPCVPEIQGDAFATRRTLLCP